MEDVFKNPKAITRSAAGFSLLVVGITLLGISVVLHGYAAVRPGSISEETIDRVVWISAPGVVLALGVLQRLGHIRVVGPGLRPRPWMSVATLALFGLAIAAVQPVPGFAWEVQQGWWLGFGPAVLLATLVLVLVLGTLKERWGEPLLKALAVSGIVLAVIVYLPSYTQPPWSYDGHHAPPVLNDVMAAYLGKFPLVDQIPQYTSLLGWPLTPVLKVAESALGSNSLLLVATIYMGLIATVLAGIGVMVAFLTLPVRYRFLAPLMVLPLFSSVSGSMSAFPARLAFPFVLLVLLIVLTRRDTVWMHLVIGVVASAGVMNNPEIGAVAAVATASVLLVRITGNKAAKLVAFAGGGLAFMVAFATIAWLRAGGIDWANFAAYARGFGDGFYALPMPLFGTFGLVLMVGSTALVVGALVLREQLSGRIETAAVVALFSGVASLGSFAYYAGRSSSSGQLQFLFPFLALSIVGLVGVIGLPGLWSGADSWQVALRRIVLLAMPAFAIAVAVQAPSPTTAWSKLLPDSSTSFLANSQAPGVEILKEASALNASRGNPPLGLAVNNSNLVAAQSGLTSVSPINYTGDVAISPLLHDVFCSQLAAHEGPILVEGLTDGSGDVQCAELKLEFVIDDRFAVVINAGSK